MSKGGIVEALASDLKHWRSILEKFRTDRWISIGFLKARKIDCAQGFIVGRETFNDPYANCNLVSKKLFEFLENEKSILNGAAIAQQIPDARDWTVTVICARLTFNFTMPGDNRHSEQTHRKQWSTVHWVCVSEQSESGPFFLTQVSMCASGACLDPAVEPDTKYDPVTVIDQESKDLLCENADKGSCKSLSVRGRHLVQELFGLKNWNSPYLAHWRNTQSHGRGSAKDVENMQNDISNGFVSCLVASTQCGDFFALPFISLCA